MQRFASATRFAVDAYVNFVENKSLLEGIASSLTEIYAPAIHQERIAGLSKHYEWADDYALAYFKELIKLEEMLNLAESG